jgi:hypothetical protein
MVHRARVNRTLINEIANYTFLQRLLVKTKVSVSCPIVLVSSCYWDLFSSFYTKTH